MTAGTSSEMRTSSMLRRSVEFDFVILPFCFLLSIIPIHRVAHTQGNRLVLAVALILSASIRDALLTISVFTQGR